MLTQFITILIFVAVIGCILYGRRLIRTEKVDAVFGNPERAKGGTHWIIVGSSAILMLWLYYSWDIAKGFYPKSANELCQVAKINESLLGLKYQFPIEEREFKSTSIIKIENKNLKKIAIEIPTAPQTNKGLKFHAAAAELKKIDDKFFKLKNHNPQFKSSIKQLKDDIKAYRKGLDDSEEIASDYAKNIVKIARRIEFASIYPPNALNEMQAAIIEFDELQNKEQGGLRLIDILLFPAGTIVASGPTCSEQGSGRWLPKPSDTFNKFVLMSKPSVGYKNIPLLWIEMVDVSKMIGFILPDWIADMLPGEYPVHTKDGIVKENFKSNVLKVVTGDFKLFKVPVPYGHIWDSFLRVFLGLVFGILIGVPLGLFMGLNRFAKGFFDPLIELYRPVPPLAWAPLIISVLGIDNTGKMFLLFMVSLSIMIISARAGASGTQPVSYTHLRAHET